MTVASLLKEVMEKAEALARLARSAHVEAAKSDEKWDRIRDAVGGDGRRRKSGGPTLANAIEGVLKRTKSPIGLTEIAKKLVAGGHETRSGFANFRTSVAHTLRKMNGSLKKSGTGYALSKPSASAEARK